ncbi:MAG: hypothetical protein Q9163_001574 [Psora crenata]
MPENKELYRFTRARFVCNEEYETSQRYVRYDVNQLARLAAEAVGSKNCVSIENCPDGMHNKVLLLNMDDGAQAIAKVPYANAGKPHFTTASEVATMDFARNVLGTPVPRVYAWSSRANENLVGAEYIIMEKAPGIQLDDVWQKMGFKERWAVTQTVAHHQSLWTSIRFQKLGSLYYAQDLDKQNLDNPLYIDLDGNEIVDMKFAVGPSNGREFVDDGRANINFDRGPWNTLQDYLLAIGDRERTCVKSVAKLPKSPITLCGPGTYQPTREKKLKALQYYSSLIEYLLPTDQSISTPSLWHSDLHTGNIFVNPNDYTEVVGFIDWQATEIAPLFNQIRQPYFLDHRGPPVRGLERPCLPENLADLDPAEREEANAMYVKRSLCSAYRWLLNQKYPRLYRALDFRETPTFELMLVPRNMLVDGEPTFLAQVVHLEKIWDMLPSVLAAGRPTLPFCFSDAEKAQIESDVEGALRGMQAMNAVQETLGDLFPELGAVQPERYEETKDALRQVKPQVIDDFAKTEEEKQAWEETWPFDD